MKGECVEQGRMVVCDRSEESSGECMRNDTALTTLGRDSQASGVTYLDLIRCGGRSWA